jgi:hypothetical protein
LAVLLAFGFTPVVLTAVGAAEHHREFFGASGLFPWDQLQYLAFVSDAHAGLIRNLFGLTGQSVYLDPVWSTSGVIQGLIGAGPVLIMAFWTAVSGLVLWASALRLVSRHLGRAEPWRRNLALVLALFGGLTILILVPSVGNTGWVGGFAIDLVPAQALWGYPATAIAIGLMPFAIEGMEDVVGGTATTSSVARTTVICALDGWLHPWQAATLLLIFLGLLIWRLHDRTAPNAMRLASPRSIGRRALPVLVGLLGGPAYYALLSHIDYSWAQFNLVDAQRFPLSWEFVEYGLLPLVLVGAVGAYAVRRDRRTRGLVLWPLMTFALVALRPPELYHSLEGLALPLGVLAVRAWPTGQRWGPRRIAFWSYAALIVVSAVLLTAKLLVFQRSPFDTAYSELRPSDVSAVRLAARLDGGRLILTTKTLGSAIPMLADAPTWVGDQFWTPNGTIRESEAGDLFAGSDTAVRARQFVVATGALALVEPCGSVGRLEAELSVIGFRERAVGCARVYWRPSAGGSGRR